MDNTRTVYENVRDLLVPRALISGASIAGPALAYWLARDGWQVDVVERAPELRGEGQNVDVRGAARDVIGWMGLTRAVEGQGTGERGTQVVDGAGVVRASFGVGDRDGDGPTAELEILRGALARLLVDASPADVSWTLGDVISGISQHGDEVRVAFESGRTGTYDLVAIAEGQRSATRRMVFGAVSERPLDVQMAFATIPRVAGDTDTWRWYNAPGGRQLHLRPDNVGTTRAMLAFRSDDRGLADLNHAEQIQMLRDRFVDAGWQAPRILENLSEDGLYFDDLTQVRASAWSHGRIVLLGDSAHCVTPIGGGGTSLALAGAYILAAQLRTGATPREAFVAYERSLRPHVTKAQRMAPGILRAAYPQTSTGIGLQRTMARLFATGSLQRVLPDPAADLDNIMLDSPGTDTH